MTAWGLVKVMGMGWYRNVTDGVMNHGRTRDIWVLDEGSTTLVGNDIRLGLYSCQCSEGPELHDVEGSKLILLWVHNTAVPCSVNFIAQGVSASLDGQRLVHQEPWKQTVGEKKDERGQR
jgi:hypothetical protein